MKIHLYALCWNENDIIPYFLRYYAEFVDRLFIYDDGSSDGSQGLLKSHPRVELRSAELGHTSERDASQFLPFYNNAWKQSRGIADWIIVCNLDEFFVHHEGLRAYLESCAEKGVNIVPSFGFDMLTWKRPPACANLGVEGYPGARSWPMNKLCAFNPSVIQEINFTPGRHFALPCGNVRFPDRIEAHLLHYHYLGFFNYVARYVEKKRRAPSDYRRSMLKIIAKFLLLAIEVKPVRREH